MLWQDDGVEMAIRKDAPLMEICTSKNRRRYNLTETSGIKQSPKGELKQGWSLLSESLGP